MIGASLRVKAAVVVLVMSVVPVGVGAVMNIRAARARAFNHEAGLLAARAEQLADRLDAFNQQYQRAVSRLAKVPDVIELLGTGDRELASSTSSISRVFEAPAD